MTNVGIISAFMDYHRKGRKLRGVLQPQVGPLIAALLPPDAHITIVNESWESPDWDAEYDLLFISCLHSDFDRARQISHYWRRRGAKTVFGGTLASTYPQLCLPYFDAIAIGDPEGCVPQIYEDFCNHRLAPSYISGQYDATMVPTPRFDLLARKQVLPLSMEVTRGCPFTCEFCALTGLGTRHHVRPPEAVVEDIKIGQHMIRDLVPWYKCRMALFTDNNIGGSKSYLHKLCAALAPLKLKWGSSITFNAVADIETVKALSASGCRFLFMGLESFNHETLQDMHKVQNAVDKTREVMDQCRAHGILVVSGLMLSPLVDNCQYIEQIPGRLTQSGLHVPTFVCFECPFPGTPHFHRLAAQSEPAFIPNGLLRDFNGYTLVTNPRRESLDDFVGAFRRLMKKAFSKRARLRKLADDVPRFMRRGYSFSTMLDIVRHAPATWNPHPDRTFVTGTDVCPPETWTVPFSEDDFDSEDERRFITEPLRVTDKTGRVLPEWLESKQLFKSGGRLAGTQSRRLRVPRVGGTECAPAVRSRRLALHKVCSDDY